MRLWIGYIYIHIYIIYIHIYIILVKIPKSSHLYDHGFTDVIPIVRQSVNYKKSFKWFTNNIRITLKTIKKTPQSIEKTCYNIKCTYECHFTFHACETRVYTLRFHFPMLFDPFNTFNTFKWCTRPSYKSIAMIKDTKLIIKSYVMQTLTAHVRVDHSLW